MALFSSAVFPPLIGHNKSGSRGFPDGFQRTTLSFSARTLRLLHFNIFLNELSVYSTRPAERIDNDSRSAVPLRRIPCWTPGIRWNYLRFPDGRHSICTTRGNYSWLMGRKFVGDRCLETLHEIVPRPRAYRTGSKRQRPFGSFFFFSFSGRAGETCCVRSGRVYVVSSITSVQECAWEVSERTTASIWFFFRESFSRSLRRTMISDSPKQLRRNVYWLVQLPTMPYPSWVNRLSALSSIISYEVDFEDRSDEQTKAYRKIGK